MLVNVLINSGCYCFDIGNIFSGVTSYSLFFGILLSSGRNSTYVIVLGMGTTCSSF